MHFQFSLEEYFHQLFYALTTTESSGEIGANEFFRHQK